MSDDNVQEIDLQPLHDSLVERYGDAAAIQPGEDEEHWYLRMQHENRMVVMSRDDLRDANAYRARKDYEARGVMIVAEDDIFGPDAPTMDANGTTEDPRAAALRALPAHERYRAYLAQRKDILGDSAAPAFSKTQ